MQFVINKNWIHHMEKKNNRALVRAGIYLQNQLERNVSYDTGDLKRSIVLRWKNENTLLIGSNKIQAYIEEEGREPGKFPNLNAISGWVVRNMGLPGTKTQGYDNQPRATKGVIFVVARKIAERGIRPKKTFSHVRDRHQDRALTLYLETLKQ